MKNQRTFMVPFFALVLIALLEGNSHAWTGVYPPSAWGNDKMIVLVGKFNLYNYPSVAYKNVQAGSAYNGTCQFVDLPYSAGGTNPLTDEVTVYASGGDDIMSVTRGGSVTCGTSTYTLYSTALDLNGHWLDGDTGSGSDYLVDYYGYPSFAWGMAGGDQILGTNESAYLLGGSGSDQIRASSTVYNGAGRNLYGEADVDCLESNNADATYTSIMDCGSGTDYYSTKGYQAGQSHVSCENSTSQHCVCLTGGMLCSAGSDCCSGTCTSSVCTAFF